MTPTDPITGPEVYSTLPWRLTTAERPGGVYTVGFGTQHVTHDGIGGVDAYRMDVGYDTLYVDGDVRRRDPDRVEIVNAAGELIVLRPAEPADAKRSGQFSQGYSLPIEVMEAIMNGMNDTELQAAVDDDEDVHTLILETRTAFWARYGSTWHKLIEPASVLANLSLVPVDDAAVPLYDASAVAELRALIRR